MKWDQLRPYQQKAINEIRALFKQGKRRAVFVCPTGGGKTASISHVMAQAAAKGSRCYFLAHRKELIDQCSARLTRHRLPHGIIKAGYPLQPHFPVQVCSVQTLARRNPEAPHIVIIDECHRAKAKTYVDLLERWPQALVIGLTATPWRLDGKPLGDVFSDLVVAAQPSELVAGGYIVEPVIYAPDTPSLKGVRTTAGDYNAKDLDNLYKGNKTLTGSIIRHWLDHARGRPTIAFCCSVEHAQQVQASFQGAGVRCGHVNGKMAVRERDEAIRSLETGSVDVMTNVSVLCEGYDLPRLSCVILARPTQSSTLYLQMVGRALRPPTQPIVLDHAGCFHEHGWPTRDREYSLEGQDQQRTSLSKSRDPYKVCPSCFAVAPITASACPTCATSLTQAIVPDETADSLILVTPKGHYDLECPKCHSRADLAYECGDRPRYELRCPKCFTSTWKTRRMPGASHAVKQAEYERLEQKRLQNGYARGWTAHRYRSIFGVWPRNMRSKS